MKMHDERCVMPLTLTGGESAAAPSKKKRKLLKRYTLRIREGVEPAFSKAVRENTWTNSPKDNWLSEKLADCYRRAHQ